VYICVCGSEIILRYSLTVSVVLDESFIMEPVCIPSETELKAALVTLRASNPTLGIKKVHALLLSNHPSWTISEKRTRKLLQSEGLMILPPGRSTGAHLGNSKVYPSSRVIEALDVGKWTKKVEVRYFDKMKGKGLVAKDKILKGEMVWKEDPFVIAPEW